jgi:hypothetical protein
VTKERKKVQRHLSRARQEMKAALQKVRDVQFSEEDVELLRRQNEAIQGMTRLLEAALSGDSDTDLDTELAELEERRQWGERRGEIVGKGSPATKASVRSASCNKVSLYPLS